MNHFSDLRRCYIVAEIGVNHNGDVELAKRLIDSAKISGADAVKFQTFSASRLACSSTPKVSYQLISSPKGESHYEMLERLELSFEDHVRLLDYCKNLKIDFISTPYDISSAAFLADIGVKYIKTASADLTDIPLQNFIASLKVPTIIATGMANLGEVEEVVNVYSKNFHEDIILLHAVSNYPCSDASLNLRSIDTLSAAFALPIGFSDHSIGFLAATIAITKGAKVIEKHFTLRKDMDGPDHQASSTPDEFSDLVKSIRRAEIMLGESVKKCRPEEVQMAQVSRKSVVLRKDMLEGAALTMDDIAMMRPGTGISPKFIPEILGRKMRFNRNVGHQIDWEDLGGATND